MESGKKQSSGSRKPASKTPAKGGGQTGGKRRTGKEAGLQNSTGLDMDSSLGSKGRGRSLRIVARRLYSWLHPCIESLLKVYRAAIARGIQNIKPFLERTWPSLRSGLLLARRVCLALGLLWIDCAIRGLGSILRSGSASLFLIVCCAALNFSILAGLFNFAVLLVVSTAAAFFLGLRFAVAVICIFGTIILWMYGSFWITILFVLIGGVFVFTDHSRGAVSILALYSAFSAVRNGGWLGLFLCANFSFIISDFAVYFLRSNSSESSDKAFHESKEGPSFKSRGWAGTLDNNTGSSDSGLDADNGRQPVDTTCMPGCSSTAGGSEGEAISPEEEVSRLLSCEDHYSVLGLVRYGDIDVSILKREYRKKAILVHPDKNMGNELAEEAFKRLQNAYEVLLDPLKRKTYEEELKREEVIMALKRFWNDAKQNGWYGPTQDGGDHRVRAADSSRKLVCRNCNKMHAWIPTERSKSHARWCQDCKGYHQAKDGDGWVEQSGQYFLFGFFQRVDLPKAYVCADNKIYEVTDWAKCQGMMKCPPNAHKPTFCVSSSINPRSNSRASKTNKNPLGNNAESFSFANLDENMTEQEFFEWLENAMASGVFDEVNDSSSQEPKTRAKLSRKKRKGKKQW